VSFDEAANEEERYPAEEQAPQEQPVQEEEEEEDDENELIYQRAVRIRAPSLTPLPAGPVAASSSSGGILGDETMRYQRSTKNNVAHNPD
jgi:hypothetical protein